MKKLILLLFLFLVFQPLFSQQWQRIGLEERAVLCLRTDPIDKNTLYAGCGNRGKEGGLYRTKDGGVSWELIIKSNVNYFDFDPNSTNTIYVSSDRFLKSVDKGKTWSFADSTIDKVDSNSSSFGEFVINPKVSQQILLVHSYGSWWPVRRLYKSENSGRDWLKQDSSKSIAVLEIDPSTENIIYGGDKSNGNIYRTTNFGNTWTLWKTRVDSGAFVYDIEIAIFDTSAIHFVAERISGFFLSMDKGTTWELYNEGLPAKSSVTQICIVDSTIYVSNYKPFVWSTGVYQSSVKNIRWEPVGDNKPFEGQFIYSLFYSSFYNKLFAGTDDGLFCYDFSTNVKRKEKPIPSKFKLNQNYPNPFNDNTVIEYEIKETTDVKLDLYDIKGNWIKNLVNESKIPGIYKATLSLNNKASGIYFYKMNGGDYEEVKKLFLVK